MEIDLVEYRKMVWVITLMTKVTSAMLITEQIHEGDLNDRADDTRPTYTMY